MFVAHHVLPCGYDGRSNPTTSVCINFHLNYSLNLRFQLGTNDHHSDRSYWHDCPDYKARPVMIVDCLCGSITVLPRIAVVLRSMTCMIVWSASATKFVRASSKIEVFWGSGFNCEDQH